MVGSNISIHHWLDRLFLGFAVLVEVVVIHIEGTVTFEAETEPLGEHHSLGVFELVLNTAVKNKLPQCELPEKIVIISDMEFNNCVYNADATNFENAKSKFEAAGYGAKDSLDRVKAFAEKYSAEMVTTRKAVDNDILPYNLQVGLTGKTVSPPVYIAVGVSGAVHHIAGMQKSGTIIAINPEKDAPIFDYADYGIIEKVENL